MKNKVGKTLGKRLAAIALTALAPLAAEAACTLDQPPNMSLGTYTGALSTSGSTTLKVQCSGQSNDYAISMNAGTGAGATTGNRKMTGPGSSTLNYGLFRDASRTQNWGNNIGVDTVPGSGHVATSNFTIYPQIPANQVAAPGTYTDTISTVTRSFTVTAVVEAMCTITATNMAFGSYTGATLDAVSTLTVTCTKTTPYYVNLGDGLHYTTGRLPRMSGPGGQLLNYTLFQNASRNYRWGNTYNYDGIAGTGNGSAQSMTVYGRVAAAQFVTPGSYTDTVIATVTY